MKILIGYTRRTMMTKQTTIDATLLKDMLGYAECYLVELDYWYVMAKGGDGGSVNSASSTVYYDFDNDYDKSLKDFKEEITELKTTITEVKKELGKQQENNDGDN